MRFIKYIFFLAALFLSPVIAQAATPVFYSVGQSASDLKTDSPTLTISGGVGMFSVAQTGNVGVGDRVTYNTSSIAYISAKTNADSAHWSLVTATGAPAGDVTDATVNSITREYTSLSAAEAGATDANHLNTSDLVVGNFQLNLPCYFDSGADTNAVTVDGYTTGADNYIKIYTPANTSTEVNNSHRHQGKWDEGKFRLEASNSTNLAIRDDFVRINGLQIKVSASHRGIIIPWMTLAGTARPHISNNIIKGENNPASSPIGIYVDVYSGVNTFIYNNLIYDLGSNVGTRGILISNETFYVYNNVIINSGIGVKAITSNAILKNNIFWGNNDGYDGSVDAASDYNISDLASDAPGANSKNNTIVRFLDAKNKDFRLDPTDTSAKNAGADLSADPDLAFNTDIAGHTRGTDGAWDIGASEAATEIFRSVGPGNTTAQATGVGNSLTIEAGPPIGGLASFTAPLPDNVGVGDVIQYDSDDNGSIDVLAFIHRRNSNKSYTVKNVSGLAPNATVAADNDWSVFRAYTSLQSAESATENTGINSGLRNFDSWSDGKDIFTSNEQWNITLYADAPESSDVVMSGWETSNQNYLKFYAPREEFEVGVSQRHAGKWDTTKAHIESSDLRSMFLNNDVRVDGIQIYNTGLSEDWNYGIRMDSAGEVKISNMIIRGNPANVGTYARGIGISASDNVHLWNNIVYDIVGSGSTAYGITGATNYYAYNNVAVNCTIGFLQGNEGVVYAKNNIAQNCGDGFYGSYETSSDHNISDLAGDAPGANSKNSTTVSFVDAGSKDFHLSPSDTSARNAGVNLQNDPNLWFEHDIDEQERTGIWDIGADEAHETRAQNASSASESDIDSGLVGHWTFDGEDVSGSTVFDKSDNGNDGTITGAVPIAGKLGQGMEFDGTNNMVEVVDNQSLDLLNQISICAWYYDSGNANGYLLSKSRTTWAYNLDVDNSTQQIEFDFGKSGVPHNTVRYPATSYIGGLDEFTNQWVYVCGTYDGVSEKIYINGLEKNSMNVSGNIVTNNDSVYLGSKDDNESFFNGKIDDVRLYDRALSAEEIGRLYRKGQAIASSAESVKGITDGLVGHWTFDGGDISGVTALDKSGNGNNGTISGAVPAMGKLGQGMMFDGSNDCVDVGSQTSLDNLNTFTWSFWAKATGEPGNGYGSVIDKSSDSTLRKYFKFHTINTGSNQRKVAMGIATDSGWASASSNTLAYNLNEWEHWTATYDDTGDRKIRIYKNGQEIPYLVQVAATGNVLDDSAYDMFLGGNPPSSFYAFNGNTDDVRIYNRALSAEEVGQLHKAGQTEIRR